MTPSVFYCTQECLFCWRAQRGDFQINWDEINFSDWELPEKIFYESLRAQAKILSGYKGNQKTNLQKLKEALTPKHVAISLSGEPTLYQHISELIQIYHSKGFTTFLVSNGTKPSRLARLAQEPTQLYISVCAPNEKIFKSICRPMVVNAWNKLNETLDLLPSFRCPTVIRITLVKGNNMKDIDGYARLLEKAMPTYIEVKAYMHIGFSNLRLDYNKMPEYNEVSSFATDLAERSGYAILDESVESRVVLLSKRKRTIRLEEN